MRLEWGGPILAMAMLLAACGSPAGSGPDLEPSKVDRRIEESAPSQEADSIVIAFLGDSLSAGRGVSENQAFPKLAEKRLRERGWEVEVLNAGVSGDTTAGGVSRLTWLLRQEPRILVIELGANDGLRGMSIEMTEANLRAMISTAQEAGVRVLLAGMMVPPNYGADYALRFASIFPDLAEELKVPLIPFLLEGVAAEPDLNQADGIHPNAAGHRRVADTVVPYLVALIEESQISGFPPDS